ncbi:MAG: helix-turn-helix domain-containing protein [Microlunatus sp.]|nr:helix-turn-helix domain-containing protein [Microlunatus sp.]
MVAQTQNTGQYWLDLRRAADYVGVNERTLRNYIATGALAASRFGPRQIRIKKDDLDALMRPISG